MDLVLPQKRRVSGAFSEMPFHFNSRMFRDLAERGFALLIGGEGFVSVRGLSSEFTLWELVVGGEFFTGWRLR